MWRGEPRPGDDTGSPRQVLLHTQKGSAMSKLSTTLLKLTLLLGGGLIGALLARWYDETLSERADKRSEHDKSRYAQGLAPLDERSHAQRENEQ